MMYDYSQAGQDEWVLSIIKGKGFFVDFLVYLRLLTISVMLQNHSTLNPGVGAFSTHNGNGKTSMSGVHFVMTKHWKNLGLKDLPNEIWRDIPLFKGRYMASNLGRIKSLSRKVWVESRGRFNVNRESILRQSNKRGYLGVALLYEGGGRLETGVHRHIGSAFIPNPLNLPQINHKDFNRSNNVVGNLEWGTSLYNINYTISHGRAANGPGEKNIKSILTEQNVLCIRENYAKCKNNKEKKREKQVFCETFKISPYTFDKVIYRSTWKHI